ncbi:hypothetical protein [Rubrivirga sp. IMCC45206]|uniref:hypothetical protein n=1 Tax=Rubrivirga sp. IMCC45206 TaxID=3391614 RepID=UPI0039901D52
MILRRITQHVKEQNWFAVALDLVIVVVGVVIGFQVTAWGDARRAAADERTVQLELRDALRDDLGILEDQLAAFHEKVRRMDALSAHLDGGGLYADTLDAYFGAVYGLSLVTVNASPYESLKSRGLGILADPALRAQAARLYDLRYDLLDELQQTQRSAVLDLMRPYVLAHFSDMVFGVTATPLDYERTRADPYFGNLVAYRREIVVGTEIPFYEGTIAEVEALLAALDAALA